MQWCAMACSAVLRRGERRHGDQRRRTERTLSVGRAGGAQGATGAGRGALGAPGAGRGSKGS